MRLSLIRPLRSKIAFWSVALAIVVAGIAAACRLSKDAQGKVADRIKVADSFDRVDTHHEGQTLVLVYLGPPDVTPADMFVSPRLSFSKVLKSGDTKLFTYLGTAWTDRTDGKDCAVDVTKFRPGVAPLPNWNLSSDQTARVNAGGGAVYEVTIVCTP